MPRLCTVASLAALASVFTCSGCTGTLNVVDNRGNQEPGIPVHTTELWVITSEYTTTKSGNTECTRERLPDKIESLATGPTYYISVHGSPLAKTSFSVKLTSDETLSELNFNSESSVPDTLNAAANVMKALPSISSVGGKAPTEKESCDSGERIIDAIRYSDWLKAH